ncbi:MAG TPA: DMT family transporter [Polyangiaceae bacterium]|nr:DMT family transporter [Polyangiaceae bacterium]
MQQPSASHPRSPWPGLLALVACAALWSLNGPLIKLLHHAEVPGITIAFYRSIIGGLAFLPLAWPRRSTARKVPWYWPAATILVFTIMTASFVIANTRTTASNAIVLQYTSPLWVFLLSPLLLGERSSRAEGAVMSIAMAGVAVIFAGNPAADLPGLGWALLSGWGYGTLTVLLRKLRPVSPTVVSALNALGSGILLLGPSLLWGRLTLDKHELVILLILALVQFTFPYFLFSWALQRIGAHKASLLLLLEVVLNPVWTFFAVGERPSHATLIGGPLILLGVASAILIGSRKAAQG